MPRPEKVQAVEEISQRFEEADAVFLTEYRGLSVAQQQRLRRNLREAGASYKVLKMSLTRRALDGRPEEGLTEWLVGPTAVAFVEGDPVQAAKALTDFAGEHDALVVKAGALEGQILPPEMVAKLARIEPREVLLSKIAGAVKAPMAKFAGMLSSFTRDAASVFSQLLEKKEADAPAEGVPTADAEAPASDERAATDEDAGETTGAVEENADAATADTDSDEVPASAEAASDSDDTADADETPTVPDDAAASAEADSTPIDDGDGETPDAEEE